MPRRSKSGNVRKLCRCARRWSCAHPWYVEHTAPKDHRTRPGERYRKNLDVLIGRHAIDLQDAQEEARRAIVAWLDGRELAEVLPGDRPTLAQLIEQYNARQGASETGKSLSGPLLRVKVQGRPFGEWRAADITREVLEQFRKQRPLVAGNRNLAYLRALFNWAVADGLLPRTPFRVGDVTVVKLARETARSRRLQPGEAERLIEAARGLAPLIVAALETGCRKGELLSLQWHQVRFTPRAELFLPAHKTKAKKDRRVPISSALRAVLDARRNDPAGEALPPHAFVFGDEVGRRKQSTKRAWERAVLVAHAHRPKYQRRIVNGKSVRTAMLNSECRELLKAIDLHFHDLRREAGSRWMDAGVPLATIQRWLGHHNIAQTSTYLAASLGGDADEMRLFEERIGRVAPLPNVALNAGSNGSEPIQSDRATIENARKTATVPEAAGVH